MLESPVTWLVNSRLMNSRNCPISSTDRAATNATGADRKVLNITPSAVTISIANQIPRQLLA